MLLTLTKAQLTMWCIYCSTHEIHLQVILIDCTLHFCTLKGKRENVLCYNFKMTAKLLHCLLELIEFLSGCEVFLMQKRRERSWHIAAAGHEIHCRQDRSAHSSLRNILFQLIKMKKAHYSLYLSLGGILASWAATTIQMTVYFIKRVFLCSC